MYGKNQMGATIRFKKERRELRTRDKKGRRREGEDRLVIGFAHGFQKPTEIYTEIERRLRRRGQRGKRSRPSSGPS